MLTPLKKQYLRLVFITVTTVCLIAWIFLGEIDVVTQASGKVIPSDYVKIVQNLEGGVIKNITVKQGMFVKEGDVLLQISAISFKSEYDSTKKRLASLTARKIRLAAESDSNDLIFPDKLIENYPEIVSSEKKEFNSRRQKREQLLKLISLAVQEYELIRKLREEGLEPEIELLKAERALAEKQQSLNDFKTTTIVEYSRVSDEIRTIEDSILTLNDKILRSEVLSPVDGVVGRVFVNTTGGVIKPGEPIVEIVPVDDKLEIEANLLPADVAFIKPGMSAAIKISAYDSSIFGNFHGSVVSISPDAITNSQGETYYQMRLTSDSGKIDESGKNLPILPGMVAQVDIITQRRTFFQYIFKPFDTIKSSSFRER